MSKSVKSILITGLVLIAAGIYFLVQSKPAVAPTLPSIKHELPTTTIFFGGDIMLSRNVAAKIYEAQDYSLPFRQIHDDVALADIAFANLESPFNNIGDHSVEGSLVFNADPKNAEGLKYAGFDILSTANNHALDQGQKGLDYTIDLLTANNILSTGTIHSTAQMQSPIIQSKNILYGFLSYSYTAYNDGGQSTSPYIRNSNNLTQLKQDILDMRGHTADVVIVNMHAGTEYTRTPTDAQIAFAHAAIDAGADLVIGEHPHWIQTTEQYKGKWIFYSLGNLVFDQMWSQETREGLTLLVTYQEQTIQKIELKPVIIENFCCPRFANQEETKTILKKINLTSPILFSTIR
ncbi:MAG: CapA family protein [Candidatus Doudnabacteria bacterium]|nr:CapA family protein [Candidatus Doudnabacteria bacterium]